MVNIICDFYSDWKAWQIEEINRLQTYGFCFPNSQDTDRLIGSYLYLLTRIPSRRPRTVVYGEGFECPEKSRVGLNRLLESVTTGESLLPYLSRGIMSCQDPDITLYDFGLHHFHLGAPQDNKTASFVQRTKELLFAHVDDSSFRVVAIGTHKSFPNTKLFSVFRRMFPDVVRRYKMPKSIASLPVDMNDQKRRALLRNNVNVSIEIDGEQYMSPGGGVMCNGYGLFEYCEHVHVHRELEMADEVAKTHFPPQIEKMNFTSLKSLHFNLLYYTKGKIVAQCSQISGVQGIIRFKDGHPIATLIPSSRIF